MLVHSRKLKFTGKGKRPESATSHSEAASCNATGLLTAFDQSAAHASERLKSLKSPRVVVVGMAVCDFQIGQEVPEMPRTGNFPPGLGVVRGLDTCTSIINAKIRACRSKKAFVSAGSHTSRFCRICTDCRKMRASYAACAPVLQSILSLCEYELSARNTLCFTAEIRGSLLRPKSTATAATGTVSVLFYPKH